jgi:hypothetical protein
MFFPRHQDREVAGLQQGDQVRQAWVRERPAGQGGDFPEVVRPEGAEGQQAVAAQEALQAPQQTGQVGGPLEGRAGQRQVGFRQRHGFHVAGYESGMAPVAMAVGARWHDVDEGQLPVAQRLFNAAGQQAVATAQFEDAREMSDSGRFGEGGHQGFRHHGLHLRGLAVGRQAAGELGLQACFVDVTQDSRAPAKTTSRQRDSAARPPIRGN